MVVRRGRNAAGQHGFIWTIATSRRKWPCSNSLESSSCNSLEGSHTLGHNRSRYTKLLTSDGIDPYDTLENGQVYKLFALRQLLVDNRYDPPALEARHDSTFT